MAIEKREGRAMAPGRRTVGAGSIGVWGNAAPRVSEDGVIYRVQQRPVHLWALWASEEIRRKYGGNPRRRWFPAAKVRQKRRINQIIVNLTNGYAGAFGVIFLF